MSLGENRHRPNPHNPRFPAQSGLSLNHWALCAPRERKQLNIADRQLLPGLQTRGRRNGIHRSQTMSATKGPRRLASTLACHQRWQWEHLATHGYILASNATWIIAARAPEGQLSSALQPVAGPRDKAHGKVELGEDGDFSLPSLVLPLSLCLHNCKSAQVIMIVYEIPQSNNAASHNEYNILNTVI